MNDSANSAASPIVIYESSWCGFCRAAKRMIESKGWDYESRSVDGNAALRADMTSITGRTSVPQIFFGDRHIGGYDDMAALEKAGDLDEAYAQAKISSSDDSA